MCGMSYARWSRIYPWIQKFESTSLVAKTSLLPMDAETAKRMGLEFGQEEGKGPGE